VPIIWHIICLLTWTYSVAAFLLVWLHTRCNVIWLIIGILCGLS
jgi:hypothetical protein